MSGPRTITCRNVEDESIEALYLAGRLDREAAQAFEEHCFQCRRCWQLLTYAANIRAAALSDTSDIPARRAVDRSAQRLADDSDASIGGGGRSS